MLEKLPFGSKKNSSVKLRPWQIQNFKSQPPKNTRRKKSCKESPAGTQRKKSQLQGRKKVPVFQILFTFSTRQKEFCPNFPFLLPKSVKSRQQQGELKKWTAVRYLFSFKAGPGWPGSQAVPGCRLPAGFGWLPRASRPVHQLLA